MFDSMDTLTDEVVVEQGSVWTSVSEWVSEGDQEGGWKHQGTQHELASALEKTKTFNVSKYTRFDFT